jgi:hypothetical protein
MTESVVPFVGNMNGGRGGREKEVDDDDWRSIGGPGANGPMARWRLIIITLRYQGPFEPSTSRNNIWGHDEL